MATLESDEVAAGVQPRASHVGVISKSATYSLAAALAANDVIEMVKVPSGARILEVILAADDLDTDGVPTLVLDVGDGSDTDRFIDGSTIGQAGGVDRLNSQVGADFEYTAEDTVDVLVQAGPATGAAAGDIHLTVLYTTAGE